MHRRRESLLGHPPARPLPTRPIGSATLTCSATRPPRPDPTRPTSSRHHLHTPHPTTHPTPHPHTPHPTPPPTTASPKLNRYICATLGLITIVVFLGVQVVYLSLNLTQMLVTLLLAPAGPFAMNWIVNHLYATPSKPPTG